MRSSANFANCRLYEPAGSRELEAKLPRLAAESGRAADQVRPDVLASSVDHDECFRAEVEKGRPPRAKVLRKLLKPPERHNSVAWVAKSSFNLATESVRPTG